MNPIRLHRLLKYHGIEARVVDECCGYFDNHFIFIVDNEVPEEEVLYVLRGLTCQRINSGNGSYGVSFLKNKGA